MKTGFTLFSLLMAVAVVFNANAQSDSLRITYDATLSGAACQPLGANKVYMHSGVGTSGPTAAWETVIGNWGQDDGIGEMAGTGVTDEWTITIHVADYYGISTQAYGIGMVFRNEDGTLEGKDKDCSDIFVRGLDTGTPVVENADGSAGDVARVEWVYPAGINDFANVLTGVSATPNPMTNQTTIRYNLTEAVDNLNIVVYNVMGQVVKTLFNGAQAPGEQIISWNGTNEAGVAVDNGVYFYAITNGNSVLTNKLMVVR